MVKYAPRKVYIRESGGYVELSYTEFCRCRESDQTYMDKLFIPIQGCLLEVVREQYTDFYRDKERWRYLQKLDTKNRLLSLDGFTDSEGCKCQYKNVVFLSYKHVGKPTCLYDIFSYPQSYIASDPLVGTKVHLY